MHRISLIAAIVLTSSFASDEVVSINYDNEIISKNIIDTDTGILEKPITLGECTGVKLKEMAEFKFDEDTQIISIISLNKVCLKNFLETRSLKLEDAKNPSVFLNYSLRTDSLNNKTLNVGVGGQSNALYYYTDGLYNSPDVGESTFKRNQSYIGYDDFDGLVRYRVGDISASTDSPILGVYGFGMQVSKRYELGNVNKFGGGLNNANIILSTRSKVVIKKDGAILRDVMKDAGIYSANQLADGLPSGDYELEITDGFGRKTYQTLNYFFSANVLKVGTYDWNIAVGKKREFGEKQDTYGEMETSGFVKYGLYEYLTIGAHANKEEFTTSFTTGFNNFSATGYFGNNIRQFDMNYQIADRINLGFGVSDDKNKEPIYTARANVYGVGVYGKKTVDGLEKGVSYSTSVFKKASLTLNAYETAAGEKMATANIVMPLDFGRNQISSSIVRNYNNGEATTDFYAASIARQEGFSGDVKVSRPDETVAATYNTNLRYDGINVVEISANKSPNADRYLSAQISGSIACVSGSCGIGKTIGNEQGFVIADGPLSDYGINKVNNFNANSNINVNVGDGMVKFQKEMALRVGQGYLVKPKKAVFGVFSVDGKGYKGAFIANGEEVLTNSSGDFMIETESDDIVVEFKNVKKTVHIDNVDEDLKLNF